VSGARCRNMITHSHVPLSGPKLSADPFATYENPPQILSPPHAPPDPPLSSLNLRGSFAQRAA